MNEIQLRSVGGMTLTEEDRSTKKKYVITLPVPVTVTN